MLLQHPVIVLEMILMLMLVDDEGDYERHLPSSIENNTSKALTELSVMAPFSFNVTHSQSPLTKDNRRPNDFNSQELTRTSSASNARRRTCKPHC